MTVFYRGPCVRITHEAFEVRCPARRSFAIRDLSEVHIVERPVDPPAAVSSVRTGSTGVAGAAAVTIALGATEGWAALESPLLMLATIALLVVSVVMAGACWRVDPRQQELVARHRGEPVCLYRTTDARTFGQVARALVRALELLADTR